MSTEGERLLGKMFIRGGAGEFRCMVQMDHGMSDCYGLTIHSIGDSWQSYTTIWEDAVAHAAEVDLSDAVSEKMEQKEMEQIPTDQIPEQAPGNPVCQRSVAEAIEAELEAEEQKVPWEEPEIPDVPPEPQLPPVPEILPNPPEPVPVTEPATEPEPVPVIEPATEPVTELATEPQPATPQMTVSEASDPAPAPQPQESPETPSSAQTVQESAQVVQGSAQTVQGSAQAARESAPAARAAASAAPDLTFPLPEEHMEAQKLWNFFSHTYPKIQAFDYSGGCEILTIKPQDIGLLPRETWVYGNNSFLLHGYYNHRYLVLARLNTPKGKPRFLIGVPGHYYNNEKYMASMFGFPNFVLSKMQPAGDGRFGYWYTDIRLD